MLTLARTVNRVIEYAEVDDDVHIFCLGSEIPLLEKEIQIIKFVITLT